jgi:hypothetical protein
MGLNSTTFVPAYTSGEVLTAADLTVTNSGVPVFADTTARDAGFGGTGEKVLAEGQLAYLEDSNVVQYYDGASWATVGPSGGMTLISTTTLTGASVSLSAIPGTFKNLQLVVRNFLPATDNKMFTIRVNGDSNANRHKGITANAAAGTYSYDSTVWNTNQIGADNAVTQSLIVFDIFDYTNTTTWKTATGYFILNGFSTQAAARASALAKLKVLGLTDDEIAALTGG